MTSLTHKILIKDRTYSVWEPVGAPDPLLHKLFHEDEIEISETGLITTIASPVINQSFPAVLVLNGGKTFGRTVTSKSGKPGRLLYQCIPNNPCLPIFLVPYDVKLDFSKVMKNKYVIVKFDHWSNAHPQGLIESTLGNVDEYFPFSEYQLHCRNLVKLQDKAFSEFTKAAKAFKDLDEAFIKSVLDDPKYKVVDLTHIDNIVSVDPEGCEDIDDAFSVRQIHDDLVQVSIYIANVPLWLSVLDLWKFVEGSEGPNRITTVYLPDRKVPMLPTVLSEDLCSLKEGKLRYAFVMHATFKVEGTSEGTFQLSSVTYENALIRVKTNYAYEDKKLLKSADYSLLKHVARILDKDSHDSHEVVATFMKFMNAQCAEKLASMNTGIFRNQAGTSGPHRTSNSTESGSHFSSGETSKGSDSCKATLEMLSATGTGGPHRTSNSTESGSHFSSGEMLSARYSIINEGHAHLGLAHYTHITSPIRRLVDLINMRIMSNLENSSSNAPLESSTIEKINKVSKSAKKAQMDCELYSKVLGADPETVYTGTIVDVDTDEFGKVTQTVYLEELKTYARVKVPVDGVKQSKMGPPRYKVYLFDDEHSLRRKIRVECIE
jgi:exoribonuclease R